jgi:serine/threonine-protein kinase
MDSAQDQREARADVRLGKLAVQKGLLREEQLQQALEEQRQGVQRGRKKPRRLGVILAEKRFLNDDQVLELLEEQEAKFAALAQRRAEDRLLGQILVDAGFVDKEKVEACLRVQDDAVRYGAEEVPLLGELLVEKGHVTADAIAEALELQKGVPAVCPRCGEHVRAGGVGGSDVCPQCQSPLEPDEPPAPEAPRPAPPPAVPELQKLGRYTIVGKLGRGAMGEVYEAHDPQLNRQAALKVIRSELGGARAGSAREVERFIKEAQLAAKLSKHPHIVSVYEADVADGLHYIAMELVRGRTLAECRQEGALTARQQVKILRTVALAVHYAHEHGVLHRDLKPANVLLDADQKPYVTDFGLARAHEPGAAADDPEARRACGTPTYISPEQAQGLPGIDRRTDIYSLGVLLYEILEGRPPFKEATRAATLQKVIHDPVPPFSGLGRGRAFTTSDREIERVCLKALAKKPEERYPTAEAFARDLAQWLDKKGAAPGPTQDDTQQLRVPPRLRVAVAAGGALVLLALAALAFRSPSGADPRSSHPQAERLMKDGDYAAAFKLYEQALRNNPSDPLARAGREEAKGKLVGVAWADFDKAMGELDKARMLVEQLAKRPKPSTLDQEVLHAEERRAAEEQRRKAEERVRACREQMQSVLSPADKER